MKQTKVKYSFAEWCRDNNHQDWLDRWDYELNGVSPECVAFRSNKQYYFKCPKGIHNSEPTLINGLNRRRAPLICKRCNSFGQFLIETFGDDAIDKYWSKQNTVDPFQIAHATNKSIWIKCQHTHHPDYLIKGSDFYKGNRCPVCSNHKIISGINDLATLRPDLVSYFLNPEDAKTIAVYSNKYMDFICPDCGNIKGMYVYDLSANGLSCKKCGGGNSYPNKFIREFLAQLGLIYEFKVLPEHVFAWSENISIDIKRRIYDFVIDENSPIIIEVHGKQHYEHGFGNFDGGKTLLEEQENDRFKKSLALQNGIAEKNYIVIDARHSNPIWIKNSILESGLLDIYNFCENDINWVRCNKVACSSAVRTVCDLYMSGITSVMELSRHVGYCKKTIHKYLKLGFNNGWCDYKEEYRYCSIMKPIKCVENGYVFSSRSLCAQVSKDVLGEKLNVGNLSAHLIGERPTCGGLHFIDITKEYFIDIKNKNPNIAFGNLH